jgi:hypothetical protein
LHPLHSYCSCQFPTRYTFFNVFVILPLYTFRALNAHHQEI